MSTSGMILKIGPFAIFQASLESSSGDSINLNY